MTEEQLAMLVTYAEGILAPDSIEQERKRAEYLKVHGPWLLRFSVWSREYHRKNRKAHRLAAETLFKRYEKATGDRRPKL